ncbi:MAG: hypothetical protein ABIM19_07820 [candidate division WOR-3 bacterium]
MRRWYPLLLLAITIMAGLPYFRQFQGDSYIHYQYAVNLARGMFMQFNPGEPSGGTTAPLWTIMLSGLYFLTGKGFMDIGAKVLGTLFAFGTGLILFRLIREFWPPEPEDYLVPFLLVLDPYYMFWAGSGMEAAAAAFALALGFLLFMKKRNWLCGLVMGLALLLRPELLIVSLFFVIMRPKAIIKLLFPGLFFCSLYYGLIYASTMTPFPASWETRRVQAAFTEYALPLGITGFTGLSLYYIFAAHMPLAVTALFAYKWRLWVAWVIIAFFVIFYTIVVPTAYGMRYIVPAIPLLVLLGTIGGRRVGLRTRYLLLLMIPFWAFGFVRKMRNVVYTSYGRNYYATAGEWLKQNTPPDVLLVAKEVQIAWFADRRVLSVDGVTDGRVSPYIKKGDDLSGFFKDYKPDYMVGLPDVTKNSWTRRTILRGVFEAGIAEILAGRTPDMVIEGIGFRLVAPGIYKLDYTEESGE